MPNEYVRYAEVTVTGRTGVRTRSWSDGSTKIVQTAQVVHKDPIIKSKSFQLEPGKFLPASTVMQFIKDCDFDYILDISIAYHTYKLMEIDESQPAITVNGAPEYLEDYRLDVKLSEPTMMDPIELRRKADHYADA